MTTPVTTWAYRAVDASGRRERGVADAASPAALSRALAARGLVVLDAQPVADGIVGAGPAPGWRGRRQDVLEITRALAALLGTGVPLAKALAGIGGITGGPPAAMLEAIRGGLAGGETLAAALQRHPEAFPPMYVGVVRAGERSGDLARAFSALAAQLERDDGIRARLVSALIYPLVLAIAGIAAVVVLVLYVLPRFASLLTEAGARLPPTTAALLATASVLERTWPFLLLLLAAGTAAVRAGLRTDRGRRVFSATLLRLPFAGRLHAYTLSARFARILGILLEGGAPLLAALDDAAASLADPLASDEVRRIRARVRDGTPLHAAVADGRLWVPLLPRLVAIGEESGRLEQFLASAAAMCEEKADRLLQRLVLLAEPAMILLFGGLVALVALSLLQAIYGIDAASFR